MSDLAVTLPATTPAAHRPPRRRLGGRTRKAFLVVHIGSAGAWFGIDVVLGVLVFTALLTDDSQIAATSLQALELFAIWPMLTASVLCIASGVVLGLGSRYGLVRYWWVLAKLVVSVAMALLIVFSLRPGLREAAAHGVRIAGTATPPAMPAELFSGLISPPIVAPSLLVFALLLSVYKPWGRIRRSRKTG